MGRKLLGMGGLTVALALGAVLVVGGRARSAERRAQVDTDTASHEEVLAQTRELEQALDDLEARLLTGRSTVRLWSEMAARHNHVSALACRNAEDHSEAIASNVRRGSRGEAQKVAAARQVTSDAQVTGYMAPGTAKQTSSTSTGKLAP